VALVLDTDSVPAEHRREALRAAMTSTVVPSLVEVAGETEQVRARIHRWQLGTAASLVHVGSSGHRVARGPRHLRGGAEERISLAIQLSGRGDLAHRDVPATGLGDLQLVDLTSPFDFVAWPASTAQALYVDAAQLGLPVDVVRAAAPRLRNSPLHDLTRDHLGHLRRVADTVDGSRTAALLGTATVELVRALLASAAESQHERQALADALMARITAYLRRHLGEADLDPARIAAAHSISVRYLHLLFARHDTSVRRWLIQERLEGARRALAAPASRRTSIAAVARRWGFTDPGHFAKRFRAAYGLSPREWQQLNAPAGPAGGRGPTASPARR
jgi:AraC-like DNA-binding protein